LTIPSAAPNTHIAAKSLGDLSRTNLAERTVGVLNIGNARNPNVVLAETGAGVVVVKDFSMRGPFVRSVLGPWLNRREIQAYRALGEHWAVPRFLGPIDAQAFAVEYRPGHYLNRRLASEVRPEFLAELEAAIAEMHDRGVVHLDLRHRTNALLGEDGRLVLIDFASALCARPGSWMARLLVASFGAVDRRAVEKWRVRLTPRRK